MRHHQCPNCLTESSILHGNKVRCGCGCWSDFDGNILGSPEKASDHKTRPMIPKTPTYATKPESEKTTVKSVQKPWGVLDLETVDELHPSYTEDRRVMLFNFTSPDEKTVKYTVEERDGVFVIFSRAYPIKKDGTGSAINFVAEKATQEEADGLIARLKRL